METIRQHFSLESKDQHVSASFVSAQIVIGPAILQATRINRQNSVMFCCVLRVSGYKSFHTVQWKVKRVLKLREMASIPDPPPFPSLQKK